MSKDQMSYAMLNRAHGVSNKYPSISSSPRCMYLYVWNQEAMAAGKALKIKGLTSE